MENEFNYVQVQEPRKNSSLGLASMILGIVGIVLTCSCFGGIILGSLGVILALLSKTEAKFESHALVGVITSSIAILLGILAIIIYFNFAQSIVHMDGRLTPFANTFFQSYQGGVTW